MSRTVSRSLRGASVLNDIGRRFGKRFLWNEQWRIRILQNENGAGRSVSDILPPRDRIWADPFLFERDGRSFMFFEEQITGYPGTLEVLELPENLPPVYEPRPGSYSRVLAKSYHLSYPQVFESAGELFMIPETHQDRGVDLYRCVGFPERWEHAERLINGPMLVDATVIHRDDGWYLLASGIYGESGSLNEKLYMYFSDSLCGKPWIPHSMNPVLVDSRYARNAGAIFQDGGRLVRPSQDCDGGYGLRLHLREITRLDREGYSEVAYRNLEPDRSQGELGIHTYNRLGTLTAVDVKIRRRRLRIRKNGA